MASFFQFSQEVKKQIEVELFDKLVGYFYKEEKLQYLGRGTSFNHHRVGKLSSGLWVAIREPLGYESKRVGVLEMNCQNAALWYHSNLPIWNDSLEPTQSSRFAIGLRYKSISSEDDLKAILIEDLTSGDNNNINRNDGNAFDRPDGIRVIYDYDVRPLDPEAFETAMREGDIGDRDMILKYLTPENCIHLSDR